MSSMLSFLKSKKLLKTKILSIKSEETEGDLSVDVYHSHKHYFIIAPLAGVGLDDIIINTSKDSITIRGQRRKPEMISKDSYCVQECFWGPFSRTIILPSDSDLDQIKATFKNGILKIQIAKANFRSSHTVKITTDPS